MIIKKIVIQVKGFDIRKRVRRQPTTTKSSTTCITYLWECLSCQSTPWQVTNKQMSWDIIQSYIKLVIKLSIPRFNETDFHSKHLHQWQYLKSIRTDELSGSFKEIQNLQKQPVFKKIQDINKQAIFKCSFSAKPGKKNASQENSLTLQIIQRINTFRIEFIKWIKKTHNSR